MKYVDKKVIIYGVILLIISAALLGYKPYSSNATGIRICPDAWYENRMPIVGGDAGEAGSAGRRPSYPQYFVINGERVEVHEMDVDWVVANCDVKSPSPVF